MKNDADVENEEAEENEVNENENETEVNFLDLPDDELGEMPEGFLNDLPESKNGDSNDDPNDESQAKESKSPEADDSINKQEKEQASSESEKEEENDQESETENKAEGQADNTDESGKSVEDQKQIKDSDDKDKHSDDETDDNSEDPLTAEKQLKQLFEPFKANGKQMRVNSVEDAIVLMKMGANYNKKMAALKPNLLLMKMLENNDLLDEGKLSYLIDLDKKDPNAINKLVKDSGIDPLQIDTESKESDTAYQPNTYTADEKEVELDSVLDGIRDTSSFNRTMDIIGTKWDSESRQVLLSNPGIIEYINSHVENGIYDQINDVIDSERMMGRLAGLNDIDAYQRVGDVLKQQGAFTGIKTNQQNKSPSETSIQKTTKKTEAEKAKLKNRKKAASPTKSAPAKGGKENFNPLALSDEEFEKVSGSDFL